MSNWVKNTITEVNHNFACKRKLSIDDIEMMINDKNKKFQQQDNYSNFSSIPAIDRDIFNCNDTAGKSPLHSSIHKKKFYSREKKRKHEQLEKQDSLNVHESKSEINFGKKIKRDDHNCIFLLSNSKGPKELLESNIECGVSVVEGSNMVKTTKVPDICTSKIEACETNFIRKENNFRKNQGSLTKNDNSNIYTDLSDNFDNKIAYSSPNYLTNAPSTANGEDKIYPGSCTKNSKFQNDGNSNNMQLDSSNYLFSDTFTSYVPMKQNDNLKKEETSILNMSENSNFQASTFNLVINENLEKEDNISNNVPTFYTDATSDPVEDFESKVVTLEKSCKIALLHPNDTNSSLASIIEYGNKTLGDNSDSCLLKENSEFITDSYIPRDTLAEENLENCLNSVKNNLNKNSSSESPTLNMGADDLELLLFEDGVKNTGSQLNPEEFKSLFVDEEEDDVDVEVSDDEFFNKIKSCVLSSGLADDDEEEMSFEGFEDAFPKKTEKFKEIVMKLAEESLPYEKSWETVLQTLRQFGSDNLSKEILSDIPIKCECSMELDISFDDNYFKSLFCNEISNNIKLEFSEKVYSDNDNIFESEPKLTEKTANGNSIFNSEEEEKYKLNVEENSVRSDNADNISKYNFRRCTNKYISSNFSKRLIHPDKNAQKRMRCKSDEISYKNSQDRIDCCKRNKMKKVWVDSKLNSNCQDLPKNLSEYRTSVCATERSIEDEKVSNKKFNSISSHKRKFSETLSQDVNEDDVYNQSQKILELFSNVEKENFCYHSPKRGKENLKQNVYKKEIEENDCISQKMRNNLDNNSKVEKEERPQDNFERKANKILDYKVSEEYKEEKMSAKICNKKEIYVEQRNENETCIEQKNKNENETCFQQKNKNEACSEQKNENETCIEQKNKNENETCFQQKNKNEACSEQKNENGTCIEQKNKNENETCVLQKHKNDIPLRISKISKKREKYDQNESNVHEKETFDEENNFGEKNNQKLNKIRLVKTDYNNYPSLWKIQNIQNEKKITENNKLNDEYYQKKDLTKKKNKVDYEIVSQEKIKDKEIVKKSKKNGKNYSQEKGLKILRENFKARRSSDTCENFKARRSSDTCYDSAIDKKELKRKSLDKYFYENNKLRINYAELCESDLHSFKINEVISSNVCSCCFIKFSTDLELAEHFRQHFEGESLKCFLCLYETKEFLTLCNHLKIHKTYEKNIFKCQYCNKKFFGILNVVYHLKLHEKNYYCFSCHKEFEDFNSLKNHPCFEVEIRNEILDTKDKSQDPNNMITNRLNKHLMPNNSLQLNIGAHALSDNCTSMINEFILNASKDESVVEHSKFLSSNNLNPFYIKENYTSIRPKEDKNKIVHSLNYKMKKSNQNLRKGLNTNDFESPLNVSVSPVKKPNKSLCMKIFSNKIHSSLHFEGWEDRTLGKNNKIMKNLPLETGSALREEENKIKFKIYNGKLYVPKQGRCDGQNRIIFNHSNLKNFPNHKNTYNTHYNGNSYFTNKSEEKPLGDCIVLHSNDFNGGKHILPHMEIHITETKINANNVSDISEEAIKSKKIYSTVDDKNKYKKLIMRFKICKGKLVCLLNHKCKNNLLSIHHDKEAHSCLSQSQNNYFSKNKPFKFILCNTKIMRNVKSFIEKESCSNSCKEDISIPNNKRIDFNQLNYNSSSSCMGSKKICKDLKSITKQILNLEDADNDEQTENQTSIQRAQCSNQFNEKEKLEMKKEQLKTNYKEKDIISQYQEQRIKKQNDFNTKNNSISESNTNREIKNSTVEESPHCLCANNNKPKEFTDLEQGKELKPKENLELSNCTRKGSLIYSDSDGIVISNKENPASSLATRGTTKVSNDNLYECSYCSFGTDKLYKLNIHLVVHSELDPFECSFCPEKFSSLKILRSHLKSHTS